MWMTRRLERGDTITKTVENDLLRFEEGYASVTADAVELAWLLWFRSYMPQTSRQKPQN